MTIVNLVKNRWRRLKVERTHVSAAGPGPFVSAEDERVAERLRVWQAVLELPRRQRIAIVLRFYEDLAEDDIASVLRCRPGTARSLVSRGMATLRVRLEGGSDG
jgi:RNA polymerase sigma factor (sigma-70 family)